ncbi:MAG: M81 family metallopeptidase [Pseudomonadota bacterium]
MTKLFIASFGAETNTFSPIPTGVQNFEEAILDHGKFTQSAMSGFLPSMHVWREMAEARGWGVTESLTAAAIPAGRVVSSVYSSFRDEIMCELQEVEGCDIVLLNLHGAMAAEHEDDCEGDLIAACREIVGPDAVIGALLDPHAHLTSKMLDMADVLVFYKEYPHTDISERARELFDIVAKTHDGEVKPVMSVADCRMVTMFFTTQEPGRSFVQDLIGFERDYPTVLSASLVHGFPWGDVEDNGAKALILTNHDEALGRALADRLVDRIWSEREGTNSFFVDLDDALRLVTDKGHGKPLVLAEFADNSGAGAPSDATFIIKKLLEQNIRDVAIGMLWDPVVLQMAVNAGEGAEIAVRLGGKVGHVSGEPVDMKVRVAALRDNIEQPFGERTVPTDRVVLLESAGLSIVVNEKRRQPVHPNIFEELGVDLAAQRALIVKSSNHFYAGFAPVAERIIHLKSPGAVTPDFAKIPFRKRSLHYWPRVEDPFADVTETYPAKGSGADG